MVDIESKEIRTEAVDFSFGELLNLHKDNEIVIQPEYQRLFRWTNEQRSRLIESILLRLPIPPIFLIESESGVLELIDGLQRTSSVLQFLDHKAIGQEELILSGCDILKDINGMKFSYFNTSIRLGVKRTPIRAVIIKKSGDEYVKYEMFKRLNTGGSLLSSQEIRNCSSRMIAGGAEFYSKLQALSSNADFKVATARIPSPDIEQRADEELVLRYFAVRSFRDEFRGNVKEWLDNFMEAMLWALLYAHYEGYCKFALTVYYDSIRSSGKLTEQLLSPTQAFALDSALRKLRGLPPVDLLCAIKTFDADHLKRPATFPDVDTESNLWPNVLNQLLEIAGLKIDYIDQNWHKIRTLVARRNKIAHGERDMIKELDYFLSFEEIIRNLMIEVAIRIDEKLCEIS